LSLLLTFYGDDFTGSTDVMEALAIHGVKTVLFTRVPNAEQMQNFKNYDCIGLAGVSRSQSPQWMEENLPAVFDWLKSLNARFCHYKVCSTFDSSPTTGSIGKAISIALRSFPQTSVPLIVGAPQLKRYTFAGHLFAGYQSETYRIDRHPVMSRHPVTPMHESDLRLHLAEQANVPVNLIDVFDSHTQQQAGQKLLELARESLPFLAGSSGIEYALMKALSARREIPGSATFENIAPCERLLVVSGSVSPTTERQIRHALATGFTGIEADPVVLAIGDGLSVTEKLTEKAIRILDEGGSPLVYAALGPASDKGAILNKIPSARVAISQALGQIAKSCIERRGLKRVIIAGGDTSSHALGELDIYALTTRKPLAQSPGSPMCRSHSANLAFSDLEIAMKGGQLGTDDYFTALKDGT
jgi:3-oxoisoapionate kinase